VSALRQSTEGRPCVLDDMLRAQARRRGGLAVATLVFVALAGLVLDPGRHPGAGTARTGAVTAARAPAGSRAAALTLARQMLARLVVPAGSQAAHPSPVPPPLSVSSAGGNLPYTVELHRFVVVREPVAAVQSFLLAHMPAGMSWAGTAWRRARRTRSRCCRWRTAPGRWLPG
jgi:hypothetical protein